MRTILITSLLAFTFSVFAANAQTEEIIYYAKLPQSESINAKPSLSSLMEEHDSRGWRTSVQVIPYHDSLVIFYNWGKKDRKRKSISFNDILGDPIRVTKLPLTPSDQSMWRDEKKIPYVIRLNKVNVYAKKVYDEVMSSDDSPAVGGILADTYYKLNMAATESNFKKLADCLFYLQHQFAIQRYDSLLKVFKPMAANFCALKEKPQITEEQRKYFVQANICFEQKKYEKAIELYNKANDLDQTAFPSAYSNLALLSAQISQFDAAIFYMKKYLLLEPDAVEIRNGQDKIYEWEILMQN